MRGAKATADLTLVKAQRELQKSNLMKLELYQLSSKEPSMEEESMMQQWNLK